MKYLIPLLFLFSISAWAQDETLQVDGDVSGTTGTSCDAAMAATVDEGADAPGNTWCTADSNNTTWNNVMSFPTPTSALDTGADIQVIDYYVRSFDEGQTNDPTFRVDIYDGIACADLHETGATTTITDAGFPAKVSDNWTAAGLSAAADVCINVVCTKATGGPGARNSCDIDAVDWKVTWAAAGTKSRITIMN